MSTSLFVDTGFWFALQVGDDRWHASASSTLQEVIRRRLRLVTSSLVVGETYTVLRVRAGREPAIRFLDSLEASARVDIIAVDGQIDREAWKLIREYSDQSFSYVDATSFALMRRNKLRRALAFDKHFATAGFVRVPLDAALR